MTSDASVTILGAGVLGLTTALQLVRKGHANVTVVSRHFPKDKHSDYTSIWAGVDFVPVSEGHTEEAQWDVESWHELCRLSREEPRAGVWMRDRVGYYRNEDELEESFKPWFRSLVQDFKILSKEEVPDFADWGTFYRTISLDPGVYLDYLYTECLLRGVEFRRKSVHHVREVATIALPAGAKPGIVVNCTGLWASKLGGVVERNLVPMRGQLVIVENQSNGIYYLSGDGTFRKEIGECCYVIERPAGGGTALGGCSYESWDVTPDMALAERIMKRAIKICPQLVPEGAGIEALRVIRHQVGLRPVRNGGPRIEGEVLQDKELGNLHVVHCYGSGGFGFQASYGMANKALKLVVEALGGQKS